MLPNTTAGHIYASKVASIGDVSTQTFANKLGCENGISPSGHIDDAMKYLGVAYSVLAQQARMATTANAQEENIDVMPDVEQMGNYSTANG